MYRQKELGPFKMGMNTQAEETTLPKDQCRSAKNVNFDATGNYSRREGTTKIATAINVHSTYSSNKSQYLFACVGNKIGVFDLTALTFTSKANMPQPYLTSWTELDGIFYASNPAFNCHFDPVTFSAYTMAVVLPDPLTITPITSGGLQAGLYTVAYSVLNIADEESALSEETQVTVVEGGGISIATVPIDLTSKLRIYASQQNGEELYRMIESTMNSATFTIGAHEMSKTGAQPETRFLAELPKGHFIEAHGSRLVVAFDKFIGFSNAFRPRLWDPRHNFVPFESLITMLASVEGGIFVSDLNGVKFLAGGDPDTFNFIQADADPAFYGSAVVVPGAHFGQDLNRYDSVVVWLSKSGHQVGLPTGQVIRLNPGQLDLPQYSVASGTFIKRNGIKRVVIPVNSNLRNGTGTAIDSSIM